MAKYYIDSSGLVKRYVEETGSALLRKICDPAAGNTITIEEGLPVINPSLDKES